MSTHQPLSSIEITLASLVRLGAAHRLDPEFLGDLRDVRVQRDLVFTEQRLAIYRQALKAAAELPEPSTEARRAERGDALNKLALMVMLLEQARAALGDKETT